MNSHNIIIIFILICSILSILFIFNNNNFEYFSEDDEALDTLSSMYSKNILTAPKLSLSGGITFDKINDETKYSINKNNNYVQILPKTSSNKMYVNKICFDSGQNSCIDLNQFKKLASLDAFIYTQGKRMYYSDASNCKIYHNPFDALNAGFISKAGSPTTYDITTNAGTKLWNGLNLIRFGGPVEAANVGLQVNVPVGHNVVWIRILNDRWTNVTVQYADTKVVAGSFAGGKRRLNKYSPDGSAADASHDVFCWMPMALTRSTPVVVTPMSGTDGGGFFISGVATSTNPWNHITNSAVAYYWNINKNKGLNSPTVGNWNSDNWNNDILWQINGGTKISVVVLVIPNNQDKLIYIINHNDTWDSAAHAGILINDTQIERLTTTYQNPFATHHNTKPYQKYLASKIPASLIGTNNMVTLTIDMTNLNGNMYIREIGTHDFMPQLN